MAWACTPQANLSLSSSGGPAGGESITVTGTNFLAVSQADGGVEIRLDSVGGALLASAAGPDFTVQVTIPATVTADTHYIYAVVRQKAELGGAVFVRSARYVVGPPPVQVTTPARGQTTNTTSGGEVRAPATSGGQTSGATSGAETTTRSGAGAGRVSGAEGRRLVTPIVNTPAVRRTESAAAPVPVPATTGASRVASTASLVGRTETARAQRTADKGSQGAGRAAARPSDRTASTDVWSGVTSGAGAAVARQATGVTVQSGSRGLQLALVTGLLGTGLVALVGGSIVATQRRRVTVDRAPVDRD